MSGGKLVFGAGAVDAFNAGDMLAVDLDYQQQTGYVGSGVAGASLLVAEAIDDLNRALDIQPRYGIALDSEATFAAAAKKIQASGLQCGKVVEHPAGSFRSKSLTFIDPDGIRRGATHVTQFHFRDGLIARETVFFDATFTRWLDVAFDDEFRAMPGVVQL